VGGVTTGYDTLPEAITAAMGKTAIITLHADATVTSTFQLNSASGITTDITIEGAGTMRTISCGGSNQILFAWDRSAWGNNYLTLGSGVTLQGKPGATQALLNGYAGAMYGTGKFTMLEGSRITGANTALTIANFDFVMKGGSIDGNRIGVQCSGSGAILENGSIKNNTFYDLSLLGTASAALKGNVEIGNLRVLNQDQLKIGGAWTGCVSALHLLGATDHVTVYEVAEKWINKRVFAAEAGHTLSAADIAKVTPGSFIWTAYNGGNAPVNGTWRYDVWSAYYGYYGFHIGSGQGDGAIGVLIPNSPEPAVTPQNTQLSVRWLGGRSGGKTIWFGKNFEVWYGTAADGSNRQQWNGAITTPAVSSGVYRETVITGLANSTTYYVWIRAKDSGGSSPYGFSRPVYGTPGGIVPAAPAAPTLTAGAGELQVSWAAVSGATAYEVWYGAVIADEYQQFGGDVTGTGAVITGLAKLSSPMGYYVRIRAKNAAGISAFGDKTSMTNVN
jgi:hypothetical protein